MEQFVKYLDNPQSLLSDINTGLAAANQTFQDLDLRLLIRTFAAVAEVLEAEVSAEGKLGVGAGNGFAYGPVRLALYGQLARMINYKFMENNQFVLLPANDPFFVLKSMLDTTTSNTKEDGIRKSIIHLPKRG